MMKKIVQFALLSIGALSLVACATSNGELINLAPQTAVITPTNIGQGKKVSLEILDNRATRTLGQKTSKYSSPVEISLANNMPNAIKDSVIRGLQNYGFQPVSYDQNAPAKLSLSITHLTYQQQPGYVKSSVQVSATIKAVAVNGDQTNTYTFNAIQKFDTAFTPSVSTDTANINLVVAQVLNQIIQSQKLMNFLAQ